MDLTKTSQKSNPYVFTSMDSLRFIQSNYFSTLSNNARSFAQKLEIIMLICALSQRMIKSMPDKYKNCMDVLNTIFNVSIDAQSPGLYGTIRSFGFICDDLMAYTDDEIPVPAGYKNGKEIKDKIYNYFIEEWVPF